MNYAFYLGFCLLGFGLAAAIFYLLGAKRRAWIPRLPWWLYFLLAPAGTQLPPPVGGSNSSTLMP
jgi:hypothetical protein